MRISTIGDVKVAVVVKRFDAYTARDVEISLRSLVENGVRKIICDFSETEYIASAGLRVMLSIAKSLQRLGGRLVLCSLSTFVKEVFDTAGFNQLLTISNSMEEALNSF